MPHANAERVQAALAAQGIAAQVMELADSTRTSAEAAAAVGVTVAQIAKSLVFLAGDDVAVMVIASGVNRVDTAKLAAHLGVARGAIKRPDADAVKRLTGFPIGGVAPVALATPMRMLLDRDLLQYDAIWAAAGTPHAVFRTTPHDLQRITSAEVIDVREEPAQG